LSDLGLVRTNPSYPLSVDDDDEVEEVEEDENAEDKDDDEEEEDDDEEDEEEEEEEDEVDSGDMVMRDSRRRLQEQGIRIICKYNSIARNMLISLLVDVYRI
jgi:TATA-binding protein-associated factor Taf7